MFVSDLALSKTTLIIFKLLMNREVPLASWKMNRHDA